MITITCSLYAGDIFSPKFTPIYYDSENKNYYIEINPIQSSGYFSKTKEFSSSTCNYLIYNLKNKTKKYIFPKNKNRNISTIIFEKKYDLNKKKIVLNTTDEENSEFSKERFIKNNKNILERELSDSILFVLKYNNPEKKSNKTEIWKSKKDGSNLKKIFILTENDTWFLDLNHKKIIIVQYNYLKTKIKELNW